MISRFFTFLCLIFPVAACSQSNVELLMEQYLWQNRVVLLFSPSADNAAFEKQNAMLNNAKDALAERDIIVWRIIHHQSVSVNGEHKVHLGTPPFYEYFDIPNDSATLILLGKDGGEKLRETLPVSNDALFSLIDSMPMRAKEINAKQQ